MFRYITLCLLALLVNINCFSQEHPAVEVRAAWLTTNWRLDWPKDSNASTSQQKRALLEILDELKENNFNMVFFQVRSQSSVFYNSKIEPRSLYLNNDSFDPLKFMIEESHKRGIECHAWFVTYSMGGNKNPQISKTQVAKKKPPYYTLYKRQWYLDPGHPQTNKYILSLVKELVSNYDIDGIHFDYIRYPDAKFTDKSSYRKYGRQRNINTWRRENINNLVAEIYDLTKSIKNWVQVSSSPLGRYRELPDQPKGWTAYETVSQDAGKWLKDGKHDMIFPMMYYKGEQFGVFLDDWIEHSNGRTVVPGLGIYQLNELNWDAEVIDEQIKHSRKEGLGQAYFRMSNYLDNDRGVKEIIDKHYQHPAKLPPLTWLEEEKPKSPENLQVHKDDEGYLVVKWDAPDQDKDYTYTIYAHSMEAINTDSAEQIFETRLQETSCKFKAAVGEFGYYYTVTASDRYHNESEISFSAFFSHSLNEQ